MEIKKVCLYLCSNNKVNMITLFLMAQGSCSVQSRKAILLLNAQTNLLIKQIQFLWN